MVRTIIEIKSRNKPFPYATGGREWVLLSPLKTSQVKGFWAFSLEPEGQEVTVSFWGLS